VTWRSRLRRALVAPCTTIIRGIASRVILEPDFDPIPRYSAVNLDSVDQNAGFWEMITRPCRTPIGVRHSRLSRTRTPIG